MKGENVFGNLLSNRTLPGGGPEKFQSIAVERGNFFPVASEEWASPVAVGINVDLTANFFHEMKNILAVLKGFLQIFSMNPKYMEDLPKLDMMNRETDYLYQMAMEYLNAARSQAAKTWMDLGEVLQEVQPLLRNIALSHRVDLQVKRLPGARIWGNAFLIRQMILNLAKNGMEAMEDGGTLRVEMKISDGHHVLTIADEGKGIPLEICRNFGEYVESQKSGGSGVGLAFCRRVLQECQAQWQFETGNTGSRIDVIFPTEEELETKNLQENYAM